MEWKINRCLRSSVFNVNVKMSVIRKHIPLLQILKELKEHQRQIIIDHLDLSACSSLTKCISTVLMGDKKIHPNQRKIIAKLIKTNKTDLRKILGKKPSAKNHQKVKRDLARIGGNPLMFLLSAGIPLLLDLIRK